jgi:hypothetical protein
MFTFSDLAHSAHDGEADLYERKTLCNLAQFRQASRGRLFERIRLALNVHASKLSIKSHELGCPQACFKVPQNFLEVAPPTLHRRMSWAFKNARC